MQQQQPRVRDAFPQVKSDPAGSRKEKGVKVHGGAGAAPKLGGGEGFRAGDAEEMLRQFDLDLRFGPMLGLTRLERWARAEELGLDPPAAVRDYLLVQQPGGSVHSSIFEGRV